MQVAMYLMMQQVTVNFYSDDQLKAFANLLGQYSVE